MKRIKFEFDVEFDKFSVIRKIMKEQELENTFDFFSEILEGVIEDKLEEELIDVDCIARESGFSVQETYNKKAKIFKSKKLKKEV